MSSSSSAESEEHDPVANLTMQPPRGILKTTKSIDESQPDADQPYVTVNHNGAHGGMTRSESKSQKIPHFDEMNIIATYHPVDKDYGHMKIEEPKTPYALRDLIDEDMETEQSTTGIDPDTIVDRLNLSSATPRQRHSIDYSTSASSDELEHRQHFEAVRKQHYNEFEVVRLHKKEIDAELLALEQDETPATSSDG